MSYASLWYWLVIAVTTLATAIFWMGFSDWEFPSKMNGLAVSM